MAESANTQPETALRTAIDSYRTAVESTVRQSPPDMLVAPRPSFFNGLASLWDFHGILRPRVQAAPFLFQNDTNEALAHIWRNVGRDILTVLPSEDDVAKMQSDRQ